MHCSICLSVNRVKDILGWLIASGHVMMKYVQRLAVKS